MNTLAQMADACIKALQSGHRIYVMGNGGSAADAEHMVGELVGRFMKKGRKALPVFSLTQNSATLTALANDFGYETVFSRQVDGLMQPQDVLIAISTSGNSPNVVIAAQAAKNKACTIFGLTGNTGGELNSFCDRIAKIPSTDTQRIQEGHTLCIHILCELIDHAF